MSETVRLGMAARVTEEVYAFKASLCAMPSMTAWSTDRKKAVKALEKFVQREFGGMELEAVVAKLARFEKEDGAEYEAIEVRIKK